MKIVKIEPTDILKFSDMIENVVYENLSGVGYRYITKTDYGLNVSNDFQVWTSVTEVGKIEAAMTFNYNKTVEKDYHEDIKVIIKKLEEIEENTHPMDCRHVTEALFHLRYYHE